MMGEWRYTEILGWNIEYQDGGVKAMNDDEGQIEVKQATWIVIWQTRILTLMISMMNTNIMTTMMMMIKIMMMMMIKIMMMIKVMMMMKLRLSKQAEW